MRVQRISGRLALVGAVAGACVPEGDTGSLGTFQIHADMTGNTCGTQAMPLDAHIAFAAELRVGHGVMRWRPDGGGTEGVGTYDTTTGAFRIALNQSYVLQAPDPRHGITGCELARADVIAGQMDLTGVGFGSDAGGDRKLSFAGQETIAFGPTDGSDCSALVGVTDGHFTTLPCTVAYGLQGAAR